MIWLVLMFVAIIILVLGFTTDILPPPLPARHRETPQATSTATPTPAAVTTLGLQAQSGRPFTFGNGLYTVDKTGRASEFTDRTTSVKPSGTFLLVFLSVANRGREPLTFSPSDFTLYDREGRKFTALREATKLAASLNEKRDVFGEALQPGLSMEAIIVFDIPKDAAGLSLRLSYGYLDVNLDR
ncbi:MAG: DUF4352 domain-containing protein [Chloroflexi bacterium]|nr:DUF4352 domain-containing protein [Chloroflexota bacterium]